MTQDSAVTSHIVVPHIIKGRVDTDAIKDFDGFRTPEIAPRRPGVAAP